MAKISIPEKEKEKERPKEGELSNRLCPGGGVEAFCTSRRRREIW